MPTWIWGPKLIVRLQLPDKEHRELRRVGRCRQTTSDLRATQLRTRHEMPGSRRSFVKGLRSAEGRHRRGLSFGLLSRATHTFVTNAQRFREKSRGSWHNQKGCS